MAGIIEHSLDTHVNPPLTSFYSVASEGLSNYVVNPFFAVATILLIVSGLAFLSGRLEVSLKSFLSSGLTIGGVAIFALSSSHFNTVLGDYLLDLPDHMMGITAGYFLSAEGGTDLSTPTKAAGSIDLMILQIQETSTRIFSFGDWDELEPYIYGGVFWLIGWIMVVVMVIALIMVKVGITMVVALAPVFILTLLFKASRDYFTKWLTFCSQFVITGAILGLYLGFTSTLITTHFTNLATSDSYEATLSALTPLLYLLPVIAVLFAMTTQYASSLSGGIAISTGNALSTITGKGTKIVNGLGSQTRRRMVRSHLERREGSRRVRLMSATKKARQIA